MNRMLSSWKEIAQFFGKGVRTVQRWEKTLDLPIRRPPGAPSNVVLARTSDLEEWMHRGPGRRADAESMGDTAELLSIEGSVGSVNSALNDLEEAAQSLFAQLGQHAGADTLADAAGSTDTASRIRVIASHMRGVTQQQEREQEPQLRRVA